MKKIWAILIVVVLLFTLSGCGKKEEPPITPVNDGSLDAVLDKGELVIGMLGDALPLSGLDDKGNLSGFHVDLANAVCEIIGVKAVFKVIDSADLASELENKSIDCVWDSSFMPQRDYNRFIFSQAYLDNQIVILSNSEVEVLSPADIFNYNTSVVLKSQAHVALLDENEEELANGKVIGYGNFADALAVLEREEVSIFLSDDISTRYNVPQNVLGSLIHVKDVTSQIAVRQGDETLRDKLQATLKSMISNYRVSDIALKWFGSDKYVPK